MQSITQLIEHLEWLRPRSPVTSADKALAIYNAAIRLRLAASQPEVVYRQTVGTKPERLAKLATTISVLALQLYVDATTEPAPLHANRIAHERMLLDKLDSLWRTACVEGLATKPCRCDDASLPADIVEVAQALSAGRQRPQETTQKELPYDENVLAALAVIFSGLASLVDGVLPEDRSHSLIRTGLGLVAQAGSGLSPSAVPRERDRHNRLAVSAISKALVAREA